MAHQLHSGNERDYALLTKYFYLINTQVTKQNCQNRRQKYCLKTCSCPRAIINTLIKLLEDAYYEICS